MLYFSTQTFGGRYRPGYRYKYINTETNGVCSKVCSYSAGRGGSSCVAGWSVLFCTEQSQVSEGLGSHHINAGRWKQQQPQATSRDHLITVCNRPHAPIPTEGNKIPNRIPGACCISDLVKYAFLGKPGQVFSPKYTRHVPSFAGFS